MKTKTFTYLGNQITFEFSSDGNLTVNATEMAKAFNKFVHQFMEDEKTILFVNGILGSVNSRYLNIYKRADLLIPKQIDETYVLYMHRILALKFASWLDPAFEFWMFLTIEKIVFGELHDLKEKIKLEAYRQARIEYLRNQIKNDPNIDEKVAELFELEEEEEKEDSSILYSMRRKIVEMKNEIILELEEENKASE